MGYFQGNQLNWAALTKKAYTIYMSVMKLPFNLADASIILRSDHLPLERFLNKRTLNAKVSNWGVELCDYNIQFKFIKGVMNTCADILSQLTNMDLTESNSPGNEGHEYGYAVFEPLLDINISSNKVSTVPAATITSMNAKNHKSPEVNHSEVNKLHLLLGKQVIELMMRNFYINR